MDKATVSSRSRLVALLLGLLMFAGICGAHRLYAGRRVSALFQFMTLGLFGLWQITDIIRLMCGSLRDDEGRRIAR